MFTLDYKSRKPLYDQLCESVERMAACGVLTQGCRLPSVRVLAEELAINPNTVQKAYRMLERNGIIQTVPGKGSFLAGRDEAKRRQKGPRRSGAAGGAPGGHGLPASPVRRSAGSARTISEKGRGSVCD